MDEKKYNKVFDDTLNEVRKTLIETTKPTEYIDTKKMSKEEKNELIKDLQDKIRRLQTEIIIGKSVNDRYIRSLIDGKYNQIQKILDDPILTLPSGKKIQFSSLSDEQLEYLESLSSKKSLWFLN